MKSLIYIGIIAWTLLSSLVAVGQNEHPILDRFEVFEREGVVYISVTISKGSICNGIDILRSADNVQFNVIGNIAGFCGSTSEPTSYSFIDTIPLINVTSYYKLELGGYGFTRPIPISIREIAPHELQIAPNPASTSAWVYFDNPGSMQYIVRIVSISGQTIWTKTTHLSALQIDVSFLTSGVYTLVLDSGNGKDLKFGKLLVYH